MKTNQDYKNEAFAALHNNWSPAVVATILYCVIIAAVVGPSEVKSMPYYLLCGSSLVGIFALNPLSVGFVNAFRMLVDAKDNRITRNMFVIGFTNWLHIVWVTFLMNVFLFLWTLLLVIPGIIKAFSYAMTPFIITEHPEMSANEAIDHGSLNKGTIVAMSRDTLIDLAKREVLTLSDRGYMPPVQQMVKVAGEYGYGMLLAGIEMARGSGQMSEHDEYISKFIAKAITGGDVPYGTEMSVEQLHDIECEGFLALAGTEKTQDRIMHMLSNGKPLRH